MTKSISVDKFKIFSGSTLKLIAIITMFIDHFAFLLGPELPFMEVPLFALGEFDVTFYFLMRKIGRLSFPIFCFLITEGFIHTKNQIKYGVRLLAFAVVSEIPYNLMVSGEFLDSSKQNIYFTLFLGFLLIYIFENLDSEIKKAVIMALVAVTAVFLHADYGLRGVLLILVMYVLRKHPTIQALLSYQFLSGGIAALAAFIPINMYNGQRGFIKSDILKYGFYLFYPVHIILLVIIKLNLK